MVMSGDGIEDGYVAKGNRSRRSTVNMPGRVDRPYFKSSISQLEALSDQAQSNLVTLRALDHELGYRTTDRATKLKARVADRIATLSVRQVSAAVGGGSAISLPVASTAAVIAFPKAPIRDQPSPQPQEKVAVSATTPPPTDLDDLPSFPTPKSTNEPTAILAAWTALEALSPQTYRRPEDLAAGDRRCVADLSAGRVPWGMGERSRPKKQLYYQVILGSIPMARATEDLVKAFGDDEERSQRAREKAPIGAVLVDKNGIVVEENGTPPHDAHVAVQYDKRWFWIAHTDIQSKYTFAIIMLLFSIADTGVKGAAPVVTIPAQ
jgi:hypothetical protein